MPILVRCDELTAGMRLAEPLVWRGRVMLAEGTELSAAEVQALRAKFPDHSLRIGDPQLDDVIDFEDDSYEREVSRATQRVITDCLSEVQERFKVDRRLTALSVHSIHSSVHEVMTYLKDHPVSAALLERLMEGDSYLSDRAGSVFYLSMLLGAANLDYVAAERERQSSSRELDPQVLQDLVPLGLGAMLMDLGMMRLQHLYTSAEPLTPDLWSQIKEHPQDGVNLLPDDFSATAKMVVRTHHENLDGTGYPDGLAQGELHVFTRIVRIADAYEAATSKRVYRQAKSAVRVLWEMAQGPYRRCYDQRLMATFTRLVQPFPIGAVLRLRDRRYAVVVKYNRENPVAPYVMVAFDTKRRRLPDPGVEGVVMLGAEPGLCGASFRDEDLSFIYQDNGREAGRSTVGVWPSLFQAAYP